MADEIEIGSKAIKQIQQLRDELLSADQALIKLSQNAIQAGKNIGGISTPGGLTKSGNDNAKISAELETLKSKYVSLSDTIVKKAEQSRLAEIQLQLAREKAFDDYSKKIAKQEQELNKKAVAEEKASQRAILAANKQAEAEAKQALSRRQSFDKNEAKLNEQATKESSAYTRIQNSVNLLNKTYQDLAIRKQLGNTLSENEEKQLIAITSRLNKYQTALKSVDSDIQRNQRNVGNYASGWNGLGNSINQITRELPAFTFSAQTGFLALSNNIPILTDEIGRLQAANKELISQGKPVKSVFSQIVGSVLSLQTAMGVAILLFTLYGKEIGNFFKGTTEAKEAQKALNEELLNAKTAVTSEITQLQSLTSIVNDHNESSENRRLAYDEIKKTLPGLTSATYEQAISTGELTKATDLYVSSLIQKNIVEAEAKAISEQQTELNKETSKSYKENIGVVESYLQSLQPERQKKNIEKTMKAQIKAEQDAQQEIINNRQKALVKSQEDYLKTQSQLNPFVTDPKKDKLTIKSEEDRLKAIAELRKKELELELANIEVKLNNEDSYYTDRLTALDADFLKRVEIAQVDYDEENRLAKGNQDKQKTALINFQLEKIKLIESYNKQKNSLESLDLDPVTKLATSKSQDKDPFQSVIESGKNVEKTLENIGNQAEKTKEKMLELSQQTREWLGSFSSEFLQNSGFGSLETFFDGTFDKLLEGAETTEEKFAVTFNAIAESAQEAFNFISNISQQNFDNENARLQSQYETALKFSGGSAVAEAKLAEDLEKKKKEISIREAKAKQKQAIFNIAIDTAQAIMATVGKTGFAGLPLALTLGALGAAQIALVASQKIPQYWMGGTHEGGLMMVNDGSGSNFRETIVTPDGGIHKPQGRNVIMDAPSGTEIFTHDQWNEQMNGMLKGNGINWSFPQSQSNNITKEDMKSAMLEAIGEQPQYHSNFDANGASNYIMKKGNITRLSSNRGNSIKQRFT